MANVAKLQSTLSNSISSHVAIEHSDNVTLQYPHSIKITQWFDLENTDKSTKSNKAITDLKIVVEKILQPKGETEFLSKDDYLLKLNTIDSSLQRSNPQDKAEIITKVILISAAAASAYATAGISVGWILASAAIGQGVTNTIFDLINKKNVRKGTDKIEIRHYTWYSFRQWLRKPNIRVHEIQLILKNKPMQFGPLESTVHYKLHISVITGEKGRLLMHEKDNIEMNIPFSVVYT